MANDNETVEQLCADIKTRIEELWEQDLGEMLNGEVDEFADRIIAAHKREIADEKRISDAVIKSLRDRKLEMEREIVAKDAEVSTLRALVGEMADALDTTIHYRDFICDCGEPSLHNCSVRSRVCFAKNRLLVMKARNVVKAEGGER